MPGALLHAVAWGLCTLLAVCGPPGAKAAERVVLCEEFTNLF
jgi:hypothetical protein